jgi:hypothetical protein
LPVVAVDDATNRKTKKMAKPVIKKETKTPAATPVASAAKKPRDRQTVLVKVSATKLKDLIGADTLIGVSRKELTQLLTKKASADVLAEAGIA